MMRSVRPAAASGQFVVDDGRVVDDGKCQLETWALLTNQGDQWWALPACNLFADTELTIGLGLGPRGDMGSPRDANVLVQAKHVLLDTKAVAIAAVLGGVVSGAPDPQQNDFGQAYFYVPSTIATATESLRVNLDIGVAHADSGGWEATWGVRPTWELTKNVVAEAELYGASADRPFLQTGFRLVAIADHLELLATYGRQLGQHEALEWAGLGVKMTTPELTEAPR